MPAVYRADDKWLRGEGHYPLESGTAYCPRIAPVRTDLGGPMKLAFADYGTLWDLAYSSNCVRKTVGSFVVENQGDLRNALRNFAFPPNAVS